MSGPPCKRYLMWPLPFLNKFSFFRFSANVTRFLILSYTHSSISCPISERLLASLSAASRAYYCVTKPALKRESSHWVPITEQRSNILEPRVCPHEKCKTQHYKALCLHTLLSIMSNIHCIDTKWGKKQQQKWKTNKKINKNKKNGVRVDYLDTPFSERIA